MPEMPSPNLQPPASNLVKEPTPRRRLTDKILKAVEDELNRKRASLDPDADIRSVTLTVKINQNTREPRAVILLVESEKTIS
jgi:hypothetical protein